MRSQVTRNQLSATDLRSLRTLLLANVFEPGAIGKRIAQARREAGLRQEDLAGLIDVSTRSVQGYEAGSTDAYRHIRQIAQVTGRPLEWILHGEPTSDQLDQGDSLGRLEELASVIDSLAEGQKALLEHFGLDQESPAKQPPKQQADPRRTRR